MRKPWIILLATSLMAGHANAQMPSASERENSLAYAVAAASADGDLRSDAAVISLLSVLENVESQPDVPAASITPRERALRAQAEVLRNELAARVDAGMMNDPELLSRETSCWLKPAKPELCAQRTQRLEALAGDNAFFHVELMGRAWKRGDAAKFLDHARAAAAATHYRSLYSGAYDSVYRRFRQVPETTAASYLKETPGASQAGVMAMAITAAFAMPAFQHVSHPCREAEGELREHCLAIALMQLESGSSTIEVLVASSLVAALGDDQERQLAQARRRDAEWLMQGMGELAQRDLQGIKSLGYEAYFNDYGRNGEIQATRDLLVANAIAATPPPDWTPVR